MFLPLPEKFSYPVSEHEILEFWKQNNIFELTLQEREGCTPFNFYEGPPTVNGKPGLHHLIARTLKDMMCRYKTQRGFYVRRQAGWDTHGLPVEIAVEKELGLTQKNQIDEIGVENFNKACKKLVYDNISMDLGWRTLTERMGYWVNLDTAYITCTNDYVESIWWALKQFFDKGLIRKGFKVVPQSPTIETPLSTHELSQAYKDVRDPNCYLKLKILSSPKKELEGAEILVWTTTPWTLFGNVGLAVGADIDYVLVKNFRETKQGSETVLSQNILVLAESRLEALDGSTEVIYRFKGTEIIGSRYEKIFDDCPIDSEKFPNALTVLPGDFVSTSDGSGIVHLAPAFGADDYAMSRKFNLPVLQPVTPGGRFTSEVGEFSGRTVKTFTFNDAHTEEGADKDIVIALKHEGKIYRSANDYLHSYPHCWRTGNPVIYYARESWFIDSPSYKDTMIALNKTIRWQPPEIGSGRFGNWLEDVKEWSLSRDRYWGTPLPIWVSEDSSEMFAVGSIEELKQGIFVKPDGTLLPVEDCGREIDLHRPFVDDVIFERNGKTFHRVTEVIDVWFDSGAMPFAQFHYPFENKELFERSFPADFIAEGIDQTRGWFYTMHNISSALFGKPAYKNIIVNELILDKNGQKMSKSKGNTVDPFLIMEKYGADAVRWYMIVNNPPWKPTLFNEDDIANTVIADFFRSLTNTYAFFALYANIDGFTGSESKIPYAERPEIDRWIISKLHSTLKHFRTLMDDYEVTRAMRLVQDFAIGDVSNWYVRRNRRRFWKGEIDAEKTAAYQTLRDVLMGILAMMSPVAPFLSEFLFQRLRAEGDSLSAHLQLLPEPDESLMNAELERRMSKAQNIVFLARSLREKSKIKTRQPLRRILVPVNSPQERRDIQAVESIITEELNVKSIEYVSDDTGIAQKSAKPNFKVIGKKFGKETQIAAGIIRALSAEEISRLEKSGSLEISVNGVNFTLAPDDVEIVSQDIEGWLVASYNGLTVALDTEIDDQLRNEGFAREFVSKIQDLRKKSGFDVTDRISLLVSCNESAKNSLAEMQNYICDETLCSEFSFSAETEVHELDINGEILTVGIQKQ